MPKPLQLDEYGKKRQWLAKIGRSFTAQDETLSEKAIEFEYYAKMLGITPDSDLNEVRKNFRKMSREIHPDSKARVHKKIKDLYQKNFEETSVSKKILTDMPEQERDDLFKAAKLRVTQYKPYDFTIEQRIADIEEQAKSLTKQLNITTSATKEDVKNADESANRQDDEGEENQKDQKQEL